MPARITPKEVAALERELKADRRREAVDSSRGYDWQKWLAVERWIELKDDETLWIEFGEDITKSTRNGVTTIQAKDLTAKISLGQSKIRDAISAGVVRSSKATTVVWTSAPPGTELGDPFGEPGIQYWGRVSSGEVSVETLRTYLLAQPLSSDALATLKGADDEAFRRVIARIRFVVGEPKITELRTRVVAALEGRLPATIGVASVLREGLADVLFAHVAKIGVQPKRENRVLTRPDLDQVALGHVDQIRRASTGEDLKLQTAIIEKTVEAIQSRQVAAGWRPPVNAQIVVSGALDSELSRRLERALARSLFEEAVGDEVVLLGAEVMSGVHDGASESVRRDVLLRASRSASIHDALKDARDFLSGALLLQGSADQAPAVARLKAAEGDADGAIRELRDATDPDGFSTLLSVILRARGTRAAIEHYDSFGNPSLLTSNGYHTLVAALALEGEESRADALLADVPEAFLRENPRLLMMRAIRTFGSMFDNEARPTVLSGLPIDVRSLKPIMPSDRRPVVLEEVINDFRRAQTAAEELGLPRAAALAASYAVWAELLHPTREEAALSRLRRDVAKFAPSAMLLVQFAFAFDPTFDPTPLEARLNARAALGGLNDEEFRAATAIAIHGKDAGKLLKFIDTNREGLIASYGEPTVVNVEIQAQVHSGDSAGARTLLESKNALLPNDLAAQLDALVGTAEGDDPVERYRTLHEQNPTAESLRALLGRLADAKLWEEFAVRAEELYGRTQSPTDLADAARTFARIRDDRNFLRVLSILPELETLDQAFFVHRGWAHLRLGEFKEAKAVAAALAGRPGQRDLDLEIAAAIGSGEWEALAALLPLYLDAGQTFTGEELIRAARLSQIIGHGPLMELVSAAVEKSPDNANVLVTAYSLVLEEGYEEDYGTRRTIHFQGLHVRVR